MIMAIMTYLYPAWIEPDEAGRWVVSFPDLPEALTDGVSYPEALHEASDCLSEALASRIVDHEEIPPPSPVTSGQHPVSPDPTIALKAALYTALHRHELTIADLADRLDIDWHQAARLIDPKRSTKLKTLQKALATLGRTIIVAIDAGKESEASPQRGTGIGLEATTSRTADGSFVSAPRLADLEQKPRERQAAVGSKSA